MKGLLRTVILQGKIKKIVSELNCEKKMYGTSICTRDFCYTTFVIRENSKWTDFRTYHVVR